MVQGECITGSDFRLRCPLKQLLVISINCSASVEKVQVVILVFHNHFSPSMSNLVERPSCPLNLLRSSRVNGERLQFLIGSSLPFSVMDSKDLNAFGTET